MRKGRVPSRPPLPAGGASHRSRPSFGPPTRGEISLSMAAHHPSSPGSMLSPTLALRAPERTSSAAASRSPAM
jgi:hypothetical protein